MDNNSSSGHLRRPNTTVSFTEDEKRRATRAANRRGLKLGPWMRMLVMEKVKDDEERDKNNDD